MPSWPDSQVCGDLKLKRGLGLNSQGPRGNVEKPHELQSICQLSHSDQREPSDTGILPAHQNNASPTTMLAQ